MTNIGSIVNEKTMAERGFNFQESLKKGEIVTEKTQESEPKQPEPETVEAQGSQNEEIQAEETAPESEVTSTEEGVNGDVDFGNEDMSIEERMKLMNKHFTQTNQKNAEEKKKWEERNTKLDRDMQENQNYATQLQNYAAQLQQYQNQQQQPKPISKDDPGYYKQLNDVLRQHGINTQFDEFSSSNEIAMAEGLIRMNNTMATNRENDVIARKRRDANDIKKEWFSVSKKEKLPKEAEYPVLSMLRTMREMNPNATLEDAAKSYKASWGISDDPTIFSEFVRNSKHYDAVARMVMDKAKSKKESQPPITSKTSTATTATPVQKPNDLEAILKANKGKSQRNILSEITKATVRKFTGGRK